MLKTRKEKLYLILIAVIVFAIAIVLIVGLSGHRSKQPAPATTPIPTPQTTTKVLVKEVEKLVEVEKEISSEVIEDGLNDMGLLITEEYYFTEVVSFSSVKKFLKTDITLGFTESSYLASYDGTVSAGVDFSRIRVEKDDEAGRITVHIPKAEIHNISIDPNSFELYSEKTGIGNPLSIEDFNTSLVELENTATGKALDRGLLDRADENAKSVISNFICSLMDTSVYSLKFVTG